MSVVDGKCPECGREFFSPLDHAKHCSVKIGGGRAIPVREKKEKAK